MSSTVDSPRAWLTVVASFLASAVTLGTAYSFGAFFESMSEEFGSASGETAVIFGNEHSGIHSDWRPHVDQYFTIPMAGLVESFNISVAAALTFRHIQRIRKNQGDLSGAELETLRAKYYIKFHK